VSPRHLRHRRSPGNWWIQFALVGTELYLRTICVAECDVDELIPQITLHTTSSSVQTERLHHRQANNELLAETEERPRACDILDVIRSRTPCPTAGMEVSAAQ
jgi:hypothetical protein